MSDDSITFRKRQPADDAFIIDVTMRTMSRVFEQSVGTPLNEETILEQIRMMDETLIIEQDGRPIGCTSYVFHAPGRMYWGSLVLSPDEQGRGVGFKTTRYIVQLARAHRCRVIDGHVQVSNRRAMRYWFKHGFHPAGPPVRGSLPIFKPI